MRLLSKMLFSVVLLIISALLFAYGNTFYKQSISHPPAQTISPKAISNTANIITLTESQDTYTSAQVTEYTLLSFTNNSLKLKNKDNNIVELSYTSDMSISLLDAQGKTISSEHILTEQDVNKRVILLMDVTANNKKLVIYGQQ